SKDRRVYAAVKAPAPAMASNFSTRPASAGNLQGLSQFISQSIRKRRNTQTGKPVDDGFRSYSPGMPAMSPIGIGFTGGRGAQWPDSSNSTPSRSAASAARSGLQ